MWFIFALLTMFMWGAADLFYKKGAESSERYSHLLTTIAVGLVMGLQAAITLIFGGIDYDPINIIIYLPVSLMYIVSMAVGYLGLKYLELSISSPVQNSSGAISSILCLVVLSQVPSPIGFVGVALVCGGVIWLGVLEGSTPAQIGEEKYKKGVFALIFPIIYAVIDALGSFFDAYYLDDIATTPLVGVTEETFEDVANVSYMLTFLIVALVLFVWLVFIKKVEIEVPKQKNKALAAVFETAGQYFYVYALSGGMAVVAGPIISAYSMVSILLSWIFLKEKLAKWQYVAIATVMLGIIALGFNS